MKSFNAPFVFLCLLLQNLLPGQNFSSSNLPIIIVQTVGGLPIQNEPKVEATMKIIDNGPGQTNFLTDPANNFDGKIGIELRGATSQGYPKKPYDIELWDENGEDIEAPILGLPKESDFALIQPLNDKSLIRDVLAYNLAAASMEYAPRTRFCELVVNGSYEGVYVLLETVKRDKNRVNVAKLAAADLAGDSLTGGYIMKFDKINGSSVGGIWASNYPPFQGAFQTTNVLLHYPKFEDSAPQQFDYIVNWFHDFENKLHAWQPNSPGAAYEQWVDVDSWVNYLLVNEISKNTDGYRLSTYFFKDRDDNDPRLHMGPVWDFNIAFGIGDYCEGENHTGWGKDFNKYCPGDGWVIHFWWEKLCRDTNFQNRIAARWKELRAGAWSDERLKFTVDSLAGLLSQAQNRNFQRWQVLGQYVWPNSFVGQTWNSEMSFLRDWLQNRVAWLDENIKTVGPSGLPPFPFLEEANVRPTLCRSGEPIVLEFRNFVGPNVAFHLFDASGREVATPEILPRGDRVRAEIRPPNLPNGVYFYEIRSERQVFKKGKIVVAG